MRAFKDFFDNANLSRLPDSVREGFAKLTLSSNKKMNAKTDEQRGKDNEQQQNSWRPSARKSLLELLTDDEDAEEGMCNKIFCSSNSVNEIEQGAIGGNSAMEDLFLSETEGSFESKDPGKKHEEEDLPCCSKSLFTRPDEDQEDEPKMANLFTDLRRLQLIEQEHLIPNKDCSLPDTVSNSGSIASKDLQNVSRDSSSGDASAVSIVTISSSLSNDDSSGNKVPDLSDDGDDDEVIVVSDSQSEQSESANVSSARPSGQTNLGTTLSNTAADRIEQFLNDVAKVKDNDTELEAHSMSSSRLNPGGDSSIPDESIEISETSVEAEPEEENNQRQSAVTESKAEKTPQRTLSAASIKKNGDKINIAATIKIKVHISEPIEVHETESAGDGSSAYSAEAEHSEDGATGNAQADSDEEGSEHTENQKESSNEKKTETGESSGLEQKYADEGANQCDENGIDKRTQSILNSLYGSSWKTPDNIRTLKNFSKFDNNITPCMESTRIDDAAASEDHQCSGTPSDIKKHESRTTGISTTIPKKAKASSRKLPGNRQSVNRVTVISATDSSSDDSFSENETPNKKGRRRSSGKLIYLDLSSEEVKVLPGYETPAAINDKGFNDRLAELLKTCEHEEKPRLESTTKKPSGSRRKLYNPNFGEERDEHIEQLQERIKESGVADDLSIVHLKIPLVGIHPLVDKTNRKKLVFSPAGPVATSRKKERKAAQPSLLEKKKLQYTPPKKYSFLASLDVSVLDWACHPEAKFYKDNFRTKKVELTEILYELYNKEVFQNELDVPINWNKRLTTTAGKCKLYKIKNKRTAKIDLSDKVLTSADRVRCTLIHELCHAATWIFDGEKGHGPTWKAWAQKAVKILPELPPIGVCHAYDIQYKYTYRCTLCKQESYLHSKSKKVDQCRCSYCLGPIEVLYNKRDKNGEVVPTPVRPPTGFAKYVKDNYKIHKKPGLNHADVMKILSNNFASLSVEDKMK